MHSLLILGAGGHGKVLADIAVNMNVFKKIAFIDNSKKGQMLQNIPVIGTDDDLVALRHQYEAIAVGIGDNHARMKKIEEVKGLDYVLPVLIHPSAVVSSFSKIERGSVIMPQTTVGPSTSIGEGVIINTGAIVEHDCVIESGVHLAPRVALAGGVTIGKNTFIGIGAVVIPNIIIEEEVIIGAGSVIIKNTKSSSKLVGNPAKYI